MGGGPPPPLLLASLFRESFLLCVLLVPAWSDGDMVAQAKTMIWEVPKIGLSSDHVANPRPLRTQPPHHEHTLTVRSAPPTRWNTRSEILANKRREQRIAAHMKPENDEPKWEQAAQPMTTAYVEQPKAATRKEMFAQRTQATLAQQAKSRAESSGRLNAKQRLDAREDQWTLARLSQAAGKSRRMMFEERKIESIQHEEKIDAANKARSFKETPTWASKGTQPFWTSKKGYVPKPKYQSCQALWTATTSKPHEHYNK